VWSLRDNLTAYDAVYLAAAAQRDRRLVAISAR
jgi:predicted nucleic acid-binding protein